MLMYLYMPMCLELKHCSLISLNNKKSKKDMLLSMICIPISFY